MVALLIEQKSSTASTWAAEQLIWMSFHSASEASEPPISHISTSPSARGDVSSSAIR